MKTLSILDGDVIAYQAAAGNSKAGGDLDDLHYRLASTVEDWTERSGGGDFVICLTVGPTFRHHKYPEYKSNRKGKPKPCGFAEARKWLEDHPKSTWDYGYEADDIMSLMATCPLAASPRVVVSTDKDFNQVSCSRYDPMKDVFSFPTPAEAENFRIQQWLCGDSVDGYIGIRGYGPKTYIKDLDSMEEPPMDMYEWGYNLYADKGYDRVYAEQMLWCATILHNSLETEHLESVRSFTHATREKPALEDCA